MKWKSKWWRWRRVERRKSLPRVVNIPTKGKYKKDYGKKITKKEKMDDGEMIEICRLEKWKLEIVWACAGRDIETPILSRIEKKWKPRESELLLLTLYDSLWPSIAVYCTIGCMVKFWEKRKFSWARKCSNC